MGVTQFHTSDFPQAGGDVSFDRSTCRGFQVASRGDILVARVGSRCIERTAFVAKGTRPFTEAVYRITLPAKARTAAFDWISSAEGQAWRRQASGGSCAKHLTVSALMSMPVPG